MQKLLELSQAHAMVSTTYRLARLCVSMLCTHGSPSAALVRSTRNFVESLVPEITHFEGWFIGLTTIIVLIRSSSIVYNISTIRFLGRNASDALTVFIFSY
jgi:hypothetical protein